MPATKRLPDTLGPSYSRLTHRWALGKCAQWHTFHQNCIMHWFRGGSHKCPLCNNLGVNDTTNSPNITGSSTRWGWWRGGKFKYKMLRQYARRKDAPVLLKKEIAKLKKLEERQKSYGLVNIRCHLLRHCNL